MRYLFTPAVGVGYTYTDAPRAKYQQINDVAPSSTPNQLLVRARLLFRFLPLAWRFRLRVFHEEILKNGLL